MVEKIKNGAIKLSNRKLLCSVIINLFLVLFCVIVFKPLYETNDDNALSQIIAGFSGENESHMVFVNYVLGIFLRLFYSINQSLPWYELFLYFISFCSLTAITYFLNKTIKSKYNIFLVILFDLFVSYELYVYPQFTKTAGFASAAGILIILLYTLFEKISIGGIAFGVVLATIGFCFRSDIFFACSLLCSSIGVYFLLRKKRLDKKFFVRRIVSCALSLVILFGAVGVVSIINNNACSSPEWDEYFDRYQVLSILYDYNELNFDEAKLAESELNIDDTDLEMLQRWNFGDPDFFSTENLNTLTHSLRNPDRHLSQFCRKMVDVFVLNYYVPFWIFAISIVLLIIRNKFKLCDFLTVLYILLSVLILYLYLYFKGRIFIHRVDCVLWFVATIPVLMIINHSRGLNLKSHLILFLSVFVVMQTLYYKDYRVNGNNTIESENREVFSEIRNDPQHLYISTTLGFHIENAYTVFEDIPFSGGTNLYYIGGWTSYAPFETKKLTRYNVKNPLSDIIDNDLVYLIDEDIDGTIAYIQKHYNKDAKAVLTKQINTHNIYKIVS